MIEGFLEYLRHERNYAELTVREYGRDLEHFQSYFKTLDDSLSWETVDSDVVRGWMECMMDSRQSATSVNRRLSALRSFYKYAMMAGLVAGNPARTVKGPKKHKPLPQFLKESEIDELLQPEMWGERFEDFRARTLLLMFYSTGIRLSEAIGLDDTMVDFTTGELRVTGKRDKQRIIPFGEELKEALQEYIRRRDNEVPRKSEALFVTKEGERMNRNRVGYEVWKHLSRVTTLRKRSPHVLRHTFATAMLNHEAGLESVKKLLGHESLSTTEIYTHATFEQLKRVYKNAHPRA
ncbi:MAG: tyrosine-type recombinase/integrase [Prevotella sp.]|jgi:integrase/recombinase XerC|nr:tyrosine-type recombinase/integrase [Prevotella sp.]